MIKLKMYFKNNKKPLDIEVLGNNFSITASMLKDLKRIDVE